MGIPQSINIVKVLVVGSNGFLGKHVKTLLDKENKYNVLEITGKEQVDITQYHSLSKYLEEKKPNIIINCAAFVGEFLMAINTQQNYYMKILQWQSIFIELLSSIT